MVCPEMFELPLMRLPQPIERGSYSRADSNHLADVACDLRNVSQSRIKAKPTGNQRRFGSCTQHPKTKSNEMSRSPSTKRKQATELQPSRNRAMSTEFPRNASHCQRAPKSPSSVPKLRHPQLNLLPQATQVHFEVKCSDMMERVTV